MPKARDPNRETAYEIYKQSKGKIDLVDIASQLNLPPGTIRGWKSKDKWSERLNGTLQSENKERSKRSKGGQLGNKNALGNKGGAAPAQNKNAVKTGEFETLFFDALEEDEKQLIALLEPDKEQLLIQEIQLLTIRERRMLKRIDDLKDLDFTLVKKRKGTEKDKWTELGEEQGVLGQIQAIENALTRVQAQKQRAIDSLHRYGFDDARLEIEIMKVEMASLKIDHPDSEVEDDGFMDAMNTEASKVWSDFNE